MKADGDLLRIARRWTPQKDFDANRLRSGLLQLAPGTLLVFDETQMDTGPLDAAGLRAVQAGRHHVSPSSG